MAAAGSSKRRGEDGKACVTSLPRLYAVPSPPGVRCRRREDDGKASERPPRAKKASSRGDDGGKERSGVFVSPTVVAGV